MQDLTASSSWEESKHLVEDSERCRYVFIYSNPSWSSSWLVPVFLLYLGLLNSNFRSHLPLLTLSPNCLAVQIEIPVLLKMVSHLSFLTGPFMIQMTYFTLLRGFCFLRVGFAEDGCKAFSPDFMIQAVLLLPNIGLLLNVRN